MNAIEQARVREAMLQQYMHIAESLAYDVVNGVNFNVFRDGCDFATLSLNTVNILDWFKRRTVRRPDFREFGPRMVGVLGDIRQWAKTQTEDIQEQAKIMAEFLGLIQNYVVTIKSM